MKLFTLLILLYSGFYVQAQCDLNPTISASSTLLCPNDILTLTTLDSFDTYQWYREGQPIEGAQSHTVEVPFYDAAAATFYVEVTQDTCTDTSPSIFIDGYAFLPIFFIQSGRYGFDPIQEAVVLCDSTQPGGPDTLILEIGLPYDTLITWYRNGVELDHTEKILVITEPGIYWASAAPTICPGFTQMTLPINVIPGTPAVIEIVEVDGILHILTDHNLFYYQWYFNGEAIEGANDPTYTPTEQGIYNVYAESIVCGSWAADFNFTISSIGLPTFQQLILVYPNPAVDHLMVELPSVETGEIQIYNMRGSLLHNTVFSNVNKVDIDTYTLPVGMYVVKIVTKHNSQSSLFVKSR